MQNKKEWIQIARYVSGNSNSRQKKIIEDRMENDIDFKQRVEEVRRAWNLSKTNPGEWNIDEAWFKIQEKISQPHTAERSLATGKTNKHNRSYFIPIFRAAAAIVIVALAGLLYYQAIGENMKSTRQNSIELVTAKGEQKSFKLNDGTSITLAADSKLRLSPNYKAGERDVFLKGEAFFDVATNPDRPFRVHVNETVTEVLGTQFNVSSYPESQTVRVVVVEGSVELEAVSTNKRVLLKPGELGMYSYSKKLIVAKVDVSPYTGWKEGKLIFEEQPLVEIVRRLERWYNLSVIVKDPEIENYKITASFVRKQPVKEVLDALAISMGITYTRNDSTVIFHKKP